MSTIVDDVGCPLQGTGLDNICLGCRGSEFVVQFWTICSRRRTNLQLWNTGLRFHRLRVTTPHPPSPPHPHPPHFHSPFRYILYIEPSQFLILHFFFLLPMFLTDKRTPHSNFQIMSIVRLMEP